jgi:DNA-binding HxlR family transcriptional regulator
MGRLSRLIPGASKKMLVHNLKRLEADSILVRRDLSEMVLHVEYEINCEIRDELFLLLDHLAEWGRLYSIVLVQPNAGREYPSD